MKKFLCSLLLLSATTAMAEDTKNEWINTTLTDGTIEKVQTAKYAYKKCVSDEMQKSTYQQQDTRNATETIIKQCEPILAKIRDVYLDAKVPGVISDRHLKQLRMQTTREVLQGMMFSEATRKSGQK
jgi:hypothetical protein